MAVSTGTDRCLHDRPEHDDRGRGRRADTRGVQAAGEPADRLLLRLSDGVVRPGGEQRHEHRSRRARCRAVAVRPVRRGVPAVRADVPSGHARRAARPPLRRDSDDSRPRARLQRRPRRVELLPAARQQRPRCRAHRALSGIRRPDAAHSQRDRRQAGAGAADFRAAPWDQPGGAERQGRRRRVSEDPADRAGAVGALRRSGRGRPHPGRAAQRRAPALGSVRPRRVPRDRRRGPVGTRRGPVDRRGPALRRGTLVLGGARGRVRSGAGGGGGRRESRAKHDRLRPDGATRRAPRGHAVRHHGPARRARRPPRVRSPDRLPLAGDRRGPPPPRHPARRLRQRARARAGAVGVQPAPRRVRDRARRARAAVGPRDPEPARRHPGGPRRRSPARSPERAIDARGTWSRRTTAWTGSSTRCGTTTARRSAA